MYLFDTNCVSELAAKVPHESLSHRFFTVLSSDRFISSIVLQELRYGACLHPRPEEIWGKVEREILPYVRVVEFDESGALEAGRLQAFLKRAGKPIGGEDIQIAATAITRQLILVTRNTRHFQNVPGLRLENWFI
jgi:tRNA(fMet)-specific endonuclease VapC